MSLFGKWKQTGRENALAILTHIGMPPQMIEQIKDLEETMEFEQNGDEIQETFIMGPKVVKEVYTMGKESEFHTWDDKTVKATPVRLSASKFKVEYEHNGIHYSAIREVASDTELIDHITLDHGKVEGKFIYTKC